MRLSDRGNLGARTHIPFGFGILSAIDARRWRHHPAVTISIERVDVAAVVQKRCDGGRVDVGHMVDLGVRLHSDLPVAVEVKAVSSCQPALVELEFPPLIGNRPQPIDQADCVGVEIHKNKFAKGLTANARQAAAAEVEVSEVLGVFDGLEFAIEGIAPTVVFTGQPEPLASWLGDHGSTPV